MASLIKLEAMYITKHLPCGSIYYKIVLKVHMWCTKVLWACGMQAEYMCICSNYIRGWYLSRFCSSNADLNCDVKGIESDSDSSIYTMFVLGIINAMMN